MPRILIVRFRRVGDAVLTTSICSTLKKSIPNAEIHYVLNENIAPLFEHHPDIDKVISFSDKELKSLFRYLKKIRQIMKEGKYDIIIDARSTINTMLFPLMSLRSKYRIGLKKSYTHFIYNYRVNNQNDPNRTNVVQQLLMLANPLTAEFDINEKPIFSLHCTQEEIEKYKNYMISKGIDIAKPIVVCAVVTRLEHKMWPLEHMKDVIQRILNKYKDAQLIFNYAGEREKTLAYQLYDMLDQDPRIFINVEAKNIRELAAVLANSNFFFGNEGGPRHISQAFSIPSYAIFPPEIGMCKWLPNMADNYQGIDPTDIDPDKTADKTIPYEEKFRLITPNRVWEVLDTMLEKYLPKEEENKEKPKQETNQSTILTTFPSRI